MTCKPGIDPQEERALIEVIQKAKRDEASRALANKAFEQLVTAHKGIIWRQVLVFLRRGGVDESDLYQAALDGLWQGILDFDHARDVRLMTYAQHWIRERVSKLYGATALPIYLPAHVREQARRDHKAGGSALSEFVRRVRHAESLEAPAHDHDARDTVGDRLADPRGSFEVDLIEGDHDARVAALIERALGDMKPRSAEIIRRRFLNDETEILEQIGASWGMTREGARCAERRALRELRAWVMRNLGSDERALLGAFERAPLTRSRHKRSRFRGVSWHKRGKRWSVDVTVDGRARYIGMFSDEVEAARAYDAEARRLLGDKAKLNFPNAAPASAPTEAQAA